MATAVTVGCHCDSGKDTTATGSAVGTGGRADTSASAANRHFMKDVASMNAMEIDLARLAVDRATDPGAEDLRANADRRSRVRRKDPQAIAADSAIDLGEPDRSLAGKRESLSKKQGADFDKAFVDEMIDDHQSLLQKLDSRVENGSHPDVTGRSQPAPQRAASEDRQKPEHSDNAITMRINEWAATTYPVAKAHLDQIKMINDSLKKKHTN